MTVKIIKFPNPKQVECTKCHCILEYQYKDVVPSPSGYEEFITCPNCKTEVKVS